MTDQDPYARGAQTPNDPSAPAGGHPYGPNWSSPTATMPPPPYGGGTQQFSSPGDHHRPPRRGRAVGLAAAGLVAVLVAGGVGGAVGYEIASPSGGGGSSVLSGASSDTGSSSSAQAPAGSVQAVAQKVLPSVVQLRGASGEGSGIVISADGLILTNAHVLEAGQAQTSSSPFDQLLGRQQQQSAAPQLQAVFQNGQSAPVQVVGTNATADLAVVRAQGVSGLTPAQLGDSSKLAVGQPLVAVGSPLGLSGTVTTGIVSALNRPVVSSGEQQGGQSSGQAEQGTVTSAIQTDAAINPGNSGGALTDMDGRVVGITSSIASLGSSEGGGSGGGQSGSIGLGFAIPINQAARIGDELARTGSSTQAVLGTTVGDANGTDGATLGQITAGGAAAAAGLKGGDVVTKLNDQVIDSANSLVAAVRAQQPGSQVTLTVSSNGAAPRQVPVTLGSERAPSAQG